jgi:multidrug efflux pump subunit AcrA (membrane-fusion protein)
LAATRDDREVHNVKPYFVSFALAVVTAACSAPPALSPRGETPQTAVTLTRAQTSQLAVQFEAGGVVRARLTAAIAGRVLAPVVDVRVRPGDRVNAGQVLLTLDGREMQAQADRASAALAAARQGLRAAESDTQAADAGLTFAAASFDRINGLHARRSATNYELEEATAAVQSARAHVAGAQARAAEAAASLTAAESAASAATISASYTVVTAPFAGRVTERFVDPGSMAAPGAPLLTLEDTALLRLEVSIDEARAREIAAGQTAGVSLDDQSRDTWVEGRISEVSRLDPARHSFVVKIDLPSSLAARPGAFGRARFTAGARSTLTVPSSALIRRGQITFVFAVDRDGFAHLRPVTTSETAVDRVEVLSGVADGEQIVDHPPATLVDGARVAPGTGR